ncbi:calcineurin B subunit-like protein [Actinidia rufa]|uniref:Calcineurin B subunit-like protein n=1 Tax=Actinidia rufa TaxID=165716 RepID=A0A7J0EV82_9ERIC|nr:calcineurin B subunit-like protein [Actinidia rufa]
MAEPDLISPLLPNAGLSQPSDEPQFIVTVDDGRGSESLPQSTHQQAPNRTHNPNHRASDTHLGMESPFGFLGVGGFDVPATATIDPFRNQTAMIEGVYECVKILICVPIAIARLLLFGLSLSVGYVATKIALQGWKDKENPMPKWRCRLMWVTRLCARCILFAFGYHWIKRRGRPAPRETAPIVVSNHVSYIEPIFFFYELFPTIVAAESHDSIPFVGTIIRAMQRKASSGRFPRLLLFPEGTTTNGRLLISFQLGAFIPGYPIQPVVVRYPHVHFDQSWGNVTLAKLMFRMFTQLHNFMEVEYLPVISPLENQKENAVHFAERTGRIIATALNVVQTSHSYGDFMLLAKASESKQTFHLSSLEAVDFLDTFLSMNPDSSGHVKVHDFCRVLRLKACRLSEKFLYGSAHVLKQPLFRQACEFAFAECHTSGNHYISEQEFGHSALQAIPNLKQFEVHELFKLFDSDGDGRISKDDFTKCLRRNPLLIALFSPQLMLKNLLGSA